jgi:hypothetical protein
LAYLRWSSRLPVRTPEAGETSNGQTVSTRIGNLAFKRGFPTGDTAKKVYDELDFQRAVQCFLWGYPAVSFEAIEFGLKRDLGADAYDIVIFDNFLDSQSLVLTGNTTTIYAVTTFDVGRDGPVVLDIPAGPAVGMVDDYWQRSLTDVGLAGPDRGKGGKFLFLPPGYTGDVPEGYFVFKSATYGNWFAMRGFLVNGDTKPAVENFKKHLRIYPLAQAANPPQTKFVNVSGNAHNTIHANDYRFYEEINVLVQEEPTKPSTRKRSACWPRLALKRVSPSRPTRG